MRRAHLLFIFQFDPYRSMIAGFFPAANMFIYGSLPEQFFSGCVQQEMVYAQTSVAAIGIAEIVPECIDHFIGVEFSYGVCPTLGHEVFESVPRFRAEQCIVDPTFGFVYINIVGHYIKVAG